MGEISKENLRKINLLQRECSWLREFLKLPPTELTVEQVMVTYRHFLNKFLRHLIPFFFDRFSFVPTHAEDDYETCYKIMKARNRETRQECLQCPHYNNGNSRIATITGSRPTPDYPGFIEIRTRLTLDGRAMLEKRLVKTHQIVDHFWNKYVDSGIVKIEHGAMIYKGKKEKVFGYPYTTSAIKKIFLEEYGIALGSRKVLREKLQNRIKEHLLKKC